LYMILVQNLQQRLSGNNFFLFLFCILLGLSSCNGLKPAQGTNTNGGKLDPISSEPRKNPKTGEYEKVTKVTEQMETVSWNEDNTQPPITSDGVNYGGNTSNNNGNNNGNTTETVPDTRIDPPSNETPTSMNYSTYNVAVMLPFMSDKFNTNNGRIYDKSKTAINFYGGMELAFQELEREGLSLNVNVLDTKASEATTASLLRGSELANAHLIIGPVRKGNVKKTAEYAKMNKKVLVSPLSPSTGLSPNNPFYLQVSPSLKSHCEAITRHALKNYDADQIVLVCRNSSAETRRLKYFQDARYLVPGGGGQSFKEFIIPDVPSEFKAIDPSSYLHPTKETVFIVPSWSSESFINSLLRVIRIAKNSNIESRKDVIVYGMPKWQEYEKISFDYYEDLNVHISSSYYMDPTSPDVQGFKQRYFDMYGAIPDENAYIGYDIMLYFGKMLKKHGDQFQKKIDQEIEQYLHTRFEFVPLAPKSFQAGSERYDVDQYENKHVNILEFREFYFQLAN